MMINLIDTHCHLDYINRDGNSLCDVLSSARENGVKKMITISTKTSMFNSDILPILNFGDDIFCSIGTHPDSSALMDFDVEKVVDIVKKNHKIVAIGETGLDFYHENNPSKDIQVEMVNRHIDSSISSGLPIIFHSRNAENETIEILKNRKCGEKFSCIMHCFTGSEDLMQACVDMNCFISISGIITFKNAGSLRDILKKIPLNKLLIETDAPFLAQVPFRRKPNSPAYLIHTFNYIADFLKIHPRALSETLYFNSHAAFPRILGN